MKRYVAFLDILGFADLVQREELAAVKLRLHLALQSIVLAKSGGAYPNRSAKNTKPFHCFSFSDTFVLASEDDSPEALVSFIIGSALLTQYLFAQSLPVRGAISYGEADFIPGTNHFVGKAIIAAHMLEKKQEWLGVVVDADSLPEGALAIFETPLFVPLFARWNVALKDGETLKNALVVNWRFNLTVEKGIRSLFRHSDDERARRKVENTLAFVKHIRESNRHIGYAMDKEGKPIRIPFLAGCNVGSKEPGKGLVHGDDL